MPNDVVHDVLYAVHCKRGLPAQALTSELEKLCRKIRVQLRWGLLGCFLAICLVAAFRLWSSSPMRHWWPVVQFLLGLLVAGAVLYLVADGLPLIRDFSRFDTYAYQARQLEAAHALAQAADLEHFGLPALEMTDKWLGLRIDRFKLRMGIHVGGSDKMAILAVIAGACTLWHNFPQDGAAYERYLYLWLAAFLVGSGIGALYVSAVLARMAYQRDLLAIAIRRLSNR